MQDGPDITDGRAGQATIAGGGASADPARSHASVAALLMKVRGRARALLVARGVAWVISAAVIALLVGGMLDYFLRSPWWLRAVGLGGAVIALAWAIGRLVLPAVVFRPSLTEIALRVERGEAGRRAGVTDRLASALELGETGAGEERSAWSRAMAGPVMDAAASGAKSIPVSSVLATGPTVRAGAAMALCAVMALGVLSAWPGLAATGLARMLWPWGSAEWPKRTQIADVTGVTVHPLGSALALRAALLKSERGPESTRITAWYRLIEDGAAGPRRTVVLTAQNRVVPVLNATGDAETPGEGVLFERLLEPTGLRPGGAGAGGSAGCAAAETRLEIEYGLESEDDWTPEARIALVEPPAVIGATLTATPPVYAGAAESATRVIELGAGADDRRAPAPLLSGSRVTLAVTLNKPVPGPATESDTIAWTLASFGPAAARLLEDAGAAANVRAEGATWTLVWTLRDAAELAVRPVDEFGIAAVEEAAFRIDALKDNPPTAVVLTPEEDQAVLATASVEIVGEGRDDVGLKDVVLERAVARRAGGSPGAQPEPIEAYSAFESTRVDEVPADAAAGGAGVRSARASGTLDLSGLTLQPGDEVWVTVLASDAYELNGERHDPVRSSPRKLRILTREELLERIWSELGQARRTALRLDADQTAAGEQAAAPGEEGARRAERAQAAISERLARQGEELARIARRMEQNGLSDAALRDTVQQAREALRGAGEKSVQASKSLGEAARAQGERPDDAQAGKPEREQAQSEQQEVRDELSRLIDLLDRGEDTFASRRALDRLLRAQKDLEERTGEAGRETAGKPSEQLTPEQREKLEQLAAEQRAAAEQLEDAVRKMGEREQKLRSNDPAAAEALARASRRAEREQVSQRMNQAAQSVEENRTGQAQQQQQQASQAIEQMLQDIDRAQSERDQVLRRLLASLLETLDGLIARQEDNLRALDQAMPTGALAGLDGPMAELHRATLGAVDLAAGGPREVQPLAETIGEAAEAQARAIGELRATPVKGEEARASEQASLDKLIEAREKAGKIDEQAEERENERQRTELRKAYQEALEQQLEIKASTEGLAGEAATRRTRAAARALGEEQKTLRTTLDDLRKSTQDIGAAKTFEFAHRRLDGLMTAAETALGEGTADAGVVRSQASAARVLKAMVDALDSSKKQNKPFRQGESGGGGGGSGSGSSPLLPPAAEVRLLREMQIEAAEATRTAGEAAGANTAEAAAAARDLQRELAQQAQDLLQRLKEEPKMEPTPGAAPDANGDGAGEGGAREGGGG